MLAFLVGLVRIYYFTLFLSFVLLAVFVKASVISSTLCLIDKSFTVGAVKILIKLSTLWLKLAPKSAPNSRVAIIPARS